jgi:N-acetyl-anhydromuramyl-L-alanine amidase AmpD
MIRHTKSIIIHHSNTPNGKHHSVRDIDLMHRERGIKRLPEFRQRQNPALEAIGYHFVIYTNGTVATGRHLDEIGNHAEGFNAKSIGLCLIGTDKFTRAQWQSLQKNVCALMSSAMHRQGDGEFVRVLGHCELPGVDASCPGFSVSDWVKNDMQPLAAHVLDEAEVAYE